MDLHTTKWQRITIWAIAIILTVGSIGSYFLIILNMNNQQTPQQEAQAKAQQQVQKEQKVDDTAFKVSGKVTELQRVDVKEGTGDEVKPGDKVRVHYKGTVAQTGVKFDSSYDRGEPITFPLSSVIKGWQDGIPGMKVGGKRRLIIPSALAYGETGAPPSIAPNTDLVFEVELLAVNPPDAASAEGQ